MNLERRIEQLESVYSGEHAMWRMDRDWLRACRRVTAGRACAADYELMSPGLLDHTRLVISCEALDRRLTWILGHDRHLEYRSPWRCAETHEERLIKFVRDV